MTRTNFDNISVHLVNDRMVVGGVATIIRMIRAEAVNLMAACTLWVDERTGTFEEETRRLGWGLTGWRKWLTLASSPFAVRLTCAIIYDKVKGRRPVLHLNTPYASTAVTTVIAAVLTRTPLVYTVHANKSHISPTYWNIENMIFRFAERFILELSVSRSDYRDKNQKKIAFIPFGVRRANTVRKWRARSPALFTFVAVNRLDPNRMVDVFIKAFSQQMGKNSSVLWLIGDGVQKAELIDLAVQLGCGDRVRFLPPVAESAIQDVLIECDCFLTLTASGEVGMAGKLAAGVGIPCLAYEFDHSESVDYSAVSIDELSEKMAIIAEATDEEQRLHAEKTTAALYASSEDMIDAYIRTYAEVTK